MARTEQTEVFCVQTCRLRWAAMEPEEQAEQADQAVPQESYAVDALEHLKSAMHLEFCMFGICEDIQQEQIEHEETEYQTDVQEETDYVDSDFSEGLDSKASHLVGLGYDGN